MCVCDADLAEGRERPGGHVRSAADLGWELATVTR